MRAISGIPVPLTFAHDNLKKSLAHKSGQGLECIVFGNCFYDGAVLRAPRQCKSSLIFSQQPPASSQSGRLAATIARAINWIRLIWSSCPDRHAQSICIWKMYLYRAYVCMPTLNSPDLERGGENDEIKIHPWAVAVDFDSEHTLL